MSLKCSIFGHKFGSQEQKEVIEEHNGEEVSVKVRERKCVRCNEIEQERFKTTIKTDNKEKKPTQDKNNNEDDKSNAEKRTKKYDRKSDSLVTDKLPNEGAVILENNRKSEDSKDNEIKQKITCKGCDYEKISETLNYRNGDCCPKCSDWLKVNNIR